MIVQTYQYVCDSCEKVGDSVGTLRQLPPGWVVYIWKNKTLGGPEVCPTHYCEECAAIKYVME